MEIVSAIGLLVWIFMLGMCVGIEVARRRDRHLIDGGKFIEQAFRDIDARRRIVGPNMHVVLIAEAISVRGRYSVKIEKEDALARRSPIR